ncbi:CopM family metallochaperone [Burkholderia gladioli]|uniref:CopM family metallochaperone n=1 Tax=Burkholderia gladioli TaxID=28095 RepID=UPI003F7A4183
MTFRHALRSILPLAAAVSLLGAPAFASAQQGAAPAMQGMQGMKMSAPNDGPAGSTTAFQNADQKMMQGMSAPPYTGDADKDFVAHMIPHHQGAIDMAEVELRYGKDPAMKKLAAGIVAAQRTEIRTMKQWQQAH